jgi:S-DNA-T family DNA segregation ATPase FtsK/SpoIIIE
MRAHRTATLPMPASEGSAMHRFVGRQIGVALGLTLLASVAAVAASLATWAVDDPSLSYSAAKPVANILGFPGAIIADLLMQFFGLGAIALLLPVVFWGWRLVFGGRRFAKTMLASWLLGALAVSGALAFVPVTAHWPLPSGMGGVLGDIVARLPAEILGAPPKDRAATVAQTAYVILAGLLLVHAAGFLRRRKRPEEIEAEAAPRGRRAAPPPVDAFAADADEGGGFLAVPLGALAHFGFSARASLGRLVGRGPAEPTPAASAPARRRRVEPRLAGADDRGLDPADLDPGSEADDIDIVPAPAARSPRGRSSRRAAEPAAALRDGGFELPPLALLSEPRLPDPRTKLNTEALDQNARVLEGVLDDFGIRGEIVNVRPGPVVTLYELEPAPGIKSSRVIGLADDIARSMSAVAARVAVIPGKNAIGIELPNQRRELVALREMLASEDFAASKARLPIGLGKTIGGEAVIVDLARMPHLLVAGTTGSGKSVAINTMILSLLYRLTPQECRLIMIDPKMLELSIYDGIPHLLTPVVTDPKKAVVALKWTVREMEDRYRKMSKLGVRNIDGYNARVGQARAEGEVLTRTIQTGFDKQTGEAIYEQETLPLDPIPTIVVIIDEMADLMMVAGKDIEGAVQRLAQMARAAGIHVIMATQIDSRTILGEQGAEQLLGQGDMLYMAGGGRIQRVHGPFVSDEEVEKIVAHLKAQGRPDYLDSITEDDGDESEGAGDTGSGGGFGGEESNDLYDKAVAVVLRDKKASTSYIQRRLAIGYNRAASLIERMEKEGLVGPANHAGKREILVEGEDERF